MLRLSLAVALICYAGCSPTATSVVGTGGTLHKLKDGSGYALGFDSRGRGAYMTVFGDDNKAKHPLRVCAEPSPDAAANLTAETARKAAVDLSISYQALSLGGKGAGESSERATSNIIDVAQRTELVLVLREALYRLCELNLNGVMNDAQAVDAYSRVLAISSDLAQRDNVGKIIALIGNKDLPDNARGPLIDLARAMTTVEIGRRSNDPQIQAASALGSIRALSDKSIDHADFIKALEEKAQQKKTDPKKTP